MPLSYYDPEPVVHSPSTLDDSYSTDTGEIRADSGTDVSATLVDEGRLGADPGSSVLMLTEQRHVELSLARESRQVEADRFQAHG